MHHVRLGRTGLHLSRLCLGTMTFGLQCDEPAAVAILDRAAAVDKTLDGALETRLDDLTREHRDGEDPR